MTDWNRAVLFIYKNGQDNEWRLERRVESQFSRPRDVLLDSLDSMLVVDMDRDVFCFLDNKGGYLFETNVPKKSTAGSYYEESGVFGLV